MRFYLRGMCGLGGKEASKQRVDSTWSSRPQNEIARRESWSKSADQTLFKCGGVGDNGTFGYHRTIVYKKVGGRGCVKLKYVREGRTEDGGETHQICAFIYVE